MAVEITPQNFQAKVLDASKQTPVLVDFWAPWCGPCLQLAPVLDALEREMGGAFTLAKLDVEAHPALGAQFKIQGIPALKLFADGRIAAEAVGAMAPAQLRSWLREFLPGEEKAHYEAGMAALQRGEAAEAEARLRAALEAKPTMREARDGLAQALAKQGRLDEAERLVEGQEGAAAARVRLAIHAATELEDSELGRLYHQGVSAAAAGRYEEALEKLLQVVRRNRHWRDDAGRLAMLDVFEVVGARAELSERYREKLSDVLF